MARNLTLPDRKPGPTFRALVGRRCAPIPAYCSGSAAWKLAGASLLGPRLVERIKEAPRKA